MKEGNDKLRKLHRKLENSGKHNDCLKFMYLTVRNTGRISLFKKKKTHISIAYTT